MKYGAGRLFHFFGSVHFAVCLIGATALFALAGTILESRTASHLFAAYYTYKHPAFLALLACFFINILFSALRRWPFKKRHIPFLLTHLGLLMVIAGIIVKESFGLQGKMTLSEGSGSHAVTVADKRILRIEKRAHPDCIGFYRIQEKQSPFPELKIDLLGYTPHAIQHLDTWIKGDVAVILGLRPIPVSTWKPEDGPLPIAGHAPILPSPNPLWDLFAIRTAHLEEAILRACLEHTEIEWRDLRGILLFEGPLQETLRNGFSWEEGKASLQLNLPFDAAQGFQHPSLEARVTLAKNPSATVKIVFPLAQTAHSNGREFPFKIVLKTKPKIGIVMTNTMGPFLFAFDASGNVWGQSFHTDHLRTLAVYEEGFGGYTAVAPIPISQEDTHVTLETPITFRTQKAPLQTKWEENTPGIILNLKHSQMEEKVFLAYDPSGKGLKRPVLNSNYLLRFEPEELPIPHHVRLRQARQLNYMAEKQAYSYECDIVIANRDTGAIKEETLSMNKVYETSDGYRFYLSHISPETDLEVKRVQLVVNRDPAKYWLTYPGSFFLSLGTIMLFWFTNTKIRKPP